MWFVILPILIFSSDSLFAQGLAEYELSRAQVEALSSGRPDIVDLFESMHPNGNDPLIRDIKRLYESDAATETGRNARALPLAVLAPPAVHALEMAAARVFYMYATRQLPRHAMNRFTRKMTSTTLQAEQLREDGAEEELVALLEETAEFADQVISDDAAEMVVSVTDDLASHDTAGEDCCEHNTVSYEGETSVGDNASAAASDRGQQCTSNPQDCCGDYIDSINNKRNLSTRKAGRKSVKEIKGRSGSKVLCCLEWDAQHGNLEVYDKNGNHQGSMFCDDPEYQDFVCPMAREISLMISTFGWGSHNQADNSGRHAPRDGCRP